MLFNTLQFAQFLVVVIGLYYLLPHRKQNALLLVASYFFYGCWDWRFMGLLFGSTAFDYWIGWLLFKEPAERKRRAIVTGGVVMNLALLGAFKYFNFFADSMRQLLELAGFHPNLQVLQIVLPVGISFYTFQSMSYTLDIYRKEMEPSSSFWDFALSVAFFPHMVAGPIQRARSLIDQIEHPRRTSVAQFAEGLHLILWGLFKKAVVADNLAQGVNSLFGSATPYEGSQVWLGMLSFALQIYCDFSGYSDIARGVAKLMGFELMLNFNLPYFARNPQDFWRRWHISLSTWLRDYLYVSLGGNRQGQARTYVNLFLTMLLGGLWHGASWTFLIWGAYHGGLLCVHRAIAPRLGRLLGERNRDSLAVRILSIAVMFVFTLYGWLIFRATSLHQLAEMTSALTHHVVFVDLIRGMARILFYAWPLVIVQTLQYWRGDLLVLLRLPLLAQVGVSLLLIYLILIQGSFDAQSFIYFQF